MNIKEKFNSLNQSISYNLYALNGYFIFFVYFYKYFILPENQINWFISSITDILFYTIYFIPSMLLIYTFEKITRYKLSFSFLQNKTISKILLFGAILSTIYFVYASFIFLIRIFL